MWANLAVANATNNAMQKLAHEVRDRIATHMTIKQITEAQELASKCNANKFKGC